LYVNRIFLVTHLHSPDSIFMYSPTYKHNVRKIRFHICHAVTSKPSQVELRKLNFLHPSCALVWYACNHPPPLDTHVAVTLTARWQTSVCKIICTHNCHRSLPLQVYRQNLLNFNCKYFLVLCVFY
jgi:hypothetical protein